MCEICQSDVTVHTTLLRRCGYVASALSELLAFDVPPAVQHEIGVMKHSVDKLLSAVRLGQRMRGMRAGPQAAQAIDTTVSALRAWTVADPNCLQIRACVITALEALQDAIRSVAETDEVISRPTICAV